MTSWGVSSDVTSTSETLFTRESVDELLRLVVAAYKNSNET